MTAKIPCYLAGASAEVERVEAAAEELEAAGFEMTEPWWERIREVRSQGLHCDADFPDRYMAESARRNENGLRVAEVIVFLCKLEGGFSGGMGYELGLAKKLVQTRTVMRLQGAEAAEPPRVYVVGNHRRFVGIWEAPQPILVPTIVDVILKEKERCAA